MKAYAKAEIHDLRVGGLTRAKSCHGPALARQPSCLVNTLVWAASRRLQIASRGSATPRRQPPRRVGFGTWALAVQLRLKPLGRPWPQRSATFAFPLRISLFEAARSAAQLRHRKIAGHDQHTCPPRAVVHSTPSHPHSTRGRSSAQLRFTPAHAHARRGPGCTPTRPSAANSRRHRVTAVAVRSRRQVVGHGNSRATDAFGNSPRSPR